MMAYPYDGKRIILALQIDHSRVAGYFAAHWGNKDFSATESLRLGCPGEQASTTLVGGNGKCAPSTLNDKGFPLDYHDGSLKYLGPLRLDFYAELRRPRAQS